MTVRTWELDIAPAECTELLADVAMGRLGVIVDGRPEIFPVNHVYDRETDCVVFPTNERTKLQAALNWPWVAYEVDGLEPGNGGGWSVSLVGRAEEITDLAEIQRNAKNRKVLWAAGNTAHWIRIVPTKVTGRRISAVVK